MPHVTDSGRELGDFLRRRRESLQPMDVGLAWGSRRRAVGLRRAEVAALAGVSESWYTWLEQGRASFTEVMLSSVAGALRLTPDETQYVVSFSRLPRIPALAAPPDEPRAPSHAALDLLRVLEPNPAYLLDENWDFLAWNDAYAELTLDLSRLAPEHRNFLWVTFCWTPYRSMLREWESEARTILGRYRASYYLRRPVTRLDDIAAFLSESPEAARWWGEHEVAGYEEAVITFDHPTRGPVRVRHVKLDLVSDPTHQITVYLPA